MSIDVKWIDQKQQILICEFHGEWTWHDCREAIQGMLYLQEGVQMPVHFVYDLTESTLPARACLSLMQKLLTLEIQPAPDQIVIVDKSYRLSTLSDMLAAITNPAGNIHFVAHRSEIYHALGGN